MKRSSDIPLFKRVCEWWEANKDISRITLRRA